MATMNPPIPPMTSIGMTAAICSCGEVAPKKRFQVQAAVATQQSISRPALLTVPETVMLSP